MEIVERKGAQVETLDLNSLSLYSPDLESQGYPTAVVYFRRAVEEADAVVIASPEYKNSMPAVLKNAIEWASRRPSVLNDRVFLIMGASPGRSGGSRMHMHTAYSLESEGAWVIPRPRVLLPNIQDVLTLEGVLIDESIGELLEQAIARTLETAVKLKTA